MVNLLETERLLEAVLPSFGMTLGRRHYGEEFLAGAEIDDNTELLTTDLAPHFKGIEGVFYRMDLTDAQDMYLKGDVPFFVRESSYKNNWNVTYQTRTSPEEKRTIFEPIADEIVARGGVLEFVDVQRNGRSVFGTEPTKKNDNLYHIMFGIIISEENAERDGIDFNTYQKLFLPIKNIEGQTYNGRQVVGMVSDFLKKAIDVE